MLRRPNYKVGRGRQQLRRCRILVIQQQQPIQGVGVEGVPGIPSKHKEAVGMHRRGTRRVKTASR